jgi:predicted acetyltransferase
VSTDELTPESIPAYLAAPIDPASAESLAAQGLAFGVIDTTDTAAFTAWLQAEARGFHDGLVSDEIIAGQLEGLAYRRTTGVWDEGALAPTWPVATVSSWIAPLTVPGESTVDAWAISAVTVAPTHRRRGIARNLLESELRTANSLGVPLAILTVSEATIYSRFGFAPAVMAADWRIDTRRASWTGPTPHGRVQFLTVHELLEQGPGLLERVRLSSPGQIEPWPLLWKRLLGLTGDAAESKKLRAVRYDDAAGTPRGFAVYRLTEKPDLFGYALDVVFLASETEDAYAGLWRFALEQDLVSEVTANLRSVEEAFRWQVSDFRAATKTTQRDHLWTRVLDVKKTLEARRYSAHGRIAIEVADRLGYAEGRYLLEIADDGSATVADLVGDVPEDAASIALGVNELGALYLGGVSAVTLSRAGRIDELREGSASAVDASFRSAVTPWLSIWF